MSLGRYQVQFDLQPWKLLDQFALCASQKFNLGNTHDWFSSFRGGYQGLCTRVHGVVKRYYQVHTWLPEPKMVEYDLSSILFHMDSAIECFAFALNALGCGAMQSDFKSVSDAKQLRKINPDNILDSPCNQPPSGYARYFPTVRSHWRDNRPLIEKIRDLHDVSKHRRTIFEGGMMSFNSPPGFFESLGLPPNDLRRALYSPMVEILLMHEPKTPRNQRTPPPADDETLEDLTERFRGFIGESTARAYQDAIQNIQLRHPFSESDPRWVIRYERL